MANILRLSTRQSDLLEEAEKQANASNNLAVPKDLPKKNLGEAPESTFVPVPHELLSDNDRRITLAGIVNERRNLMGTAHAEHFIK
jgi:hypothetical protein